MGPFLSKIFGAKNGKKIGDGIGNLVDRFVLTKEEKQEFEMDLKKLL